MDLRAAEGVEGDVLAGRDPDHLRAGDEHVADAVDHEREVRDRRRVDRTASAWTEDEAELRNDPARLDVAPEDLRVARERDDAFLDPRTARIVDADDRDPVREREVHDLDHLLGKYLAERAAEHARVVAEEHHVAPVDLREPGDHAVARHAARMPREQVDLLEGVAIDQARDPLPRGELALGVLAVEGLGVAVACFVLALTKLIEWVDLPRRHFCMNIQRWPSRSSAR